MIKIEVTGASIGEVADKLLAIGSSLRKSDGVALFAAPHPVNDSVSVPEDIAPAALEEVEVEVAEVAPVDPTPAQTGEAALPAEPATEPAAPEPTTSAPSAEASASELDFDTDVAPYVLQVVKEKGKPVAQEILSQFGVDRASLLEPHLWPELVEQLKGAL